MRFLARRRETRSARSRGGKDKEILGGDANAASAFTQAARAPCGDIVFTFAHISRFPSNVVRARRDRNIADDTRSTEKITLA